MKILQFEWDNAIGEEHNGKSVIIGQHLPKSQNEEASHLELYGISLDITDDSKDFRLKRISCFGENIVSDVKEITKREARELLINEVDKALDVMYDKTEIESVDNHFNVVEEVVEDNEDNEELEFQ